MSDELGQTIHERHYGHRLRDCSEACAGWRAPAAMTDQVPRTEPGDHPTLKGKRYPSFDNGAREMVFAIEVDWPQGGPFDRFEAIWVLRSEALADRVVEALADERGAGFEGLREALDAHEYEYRAGHAACSCRWEGAIKPVRGEEWPTPSYTEWLDHREQAVRAALDAAHPFLAGSAS